MNLSDKEWKELRKLLNKAWDAGIGRGSKVLYAYGPTYISVFSIKDRRYRDVSKILKEAQAVDWSKLSKPDNVEA